MKKFIIFLLLIFLASCAIANKDEQRQNIVSKQEIELMSYFREGMYYFKSSKYLDAVWSFYKALQIEDSPKIQYNLSLALERLGDTDNALSIMMKLYHNYPDDINYKIAYARMLELIGSKDEAVSIYNETLSKLHNKIEVKDYKYKVFRRLSDLNFKIGNEEDAICYSQLAFQERNSNDELVRHARLLLSVNVSFDAIDNIIKEFLEIHENKTQEKKVENLGVIEDENINDRENNKECRLESIQVWELLPNLKENYEKVTGIIDRSKECLPNKDMYYATLLVVENIVKMYREALIKDKTDSDDDDHAEQPFESISDATLLTLPAMAYQYLEYFSPEYHIVKNGALN